MKLHVRLEQDAERALVVKRAESPDAIEHLRAEAAMLRRLRHPGVVELVDIREVDGAVELVTLFGGSATLGDLVPPHPGAVAGAMAAVAKTVEDLHRVGVAHGGLTADHVVLGPSRHPVLCSFGAAGPADDAGVRADAAALLSLAGDLLQRCRAPTTRLGRRQRRMVSDALTEWERSDPDVASLAAALASIPGAAAPAAADCGLREDTPIVVDDDGLPIGARAAAPDDEVDVRTWRDRVPPLASGFSVARPSRTRFVGIAAGVGVSALALAGVLAIVASSGVEEPRQAPAPTRTTGEPAGEGKPPRSATAAAGAAQDVACVRRSDTGCVDDIVVSGNMIRVGPQWFQVGEPGDLVELGDWNCDGVRTPALLRPATGDVFVFTRWPDRSVPVEAGAAARAPGAAALTARRTGGCDVLYTADSLGISSSEPVLVP